MEKVSWVYNLRKVDLIKELRKAGLSPRKTATVDTLREKLIKHIRRQATARMATDSSNTSTDTSNPEPPSVQSKPLCEQIRKWNVKFDGKADSISFLERLDELISAYEINPDQLLNTLPELLKGPALLWCRNNRTDWQTWKDFQDAFKQQYLPTRYLIHLEDDIRTRTQGNKESAAEYITAIQTLMRRHGQMSAASQTERIFHNLRPEFRAYIRRSDFKTLSELIQLTREFEELQEELKKFKEPPAPSQAYVTETAYTNSKKPEAIHSIYNKATVKTDPRENINPTPWVQNKQLPVPTGNPSTLRNSCWRCGEQGHLRYNCRNKPRIFCSRCGKDGTLSINCKCQGNEQLPRRH